MARPVAPGQTLAAEAAPSQRQWLKKLACLEAEIEAGPNQVAALKQALKKLIRLTGQQVQVDRIVTTSKGEKRDV